MCVCEREREREREEGERDWLMYHDIVTTPPVVLVTPETEKSTTLTKHAGAPKETIFAISPATEIMQ